METRINKENVEFAKEMVKSISLALDKVEAGSDVEDDYLYEKINKLFNLIKCQE